MTRPVLALDLGSSSVRAVVFDAHLRQVTTRRAGTSIWQDARGAATLDGQAYVAAVSDCLDDLHASGALAGVGAVAWSCQWHSLIPLDASGGQAAPGLSWMDTRPTWRVGAAPADPVDFHQRTGAWWHPLYWPVRIGWLRKQGVRAARWTGLGGYLAGRLLDTGGATSISEASGTGAMDTLTCRWDPEALELAGITEKEVPAIAADGWRGRLTADLARRWPDLAAADWSLPVGDGAASAIGSGCLGPDRLSVTFGTSAAVRLVYPGADRVPQFAWRYRVDGSRSLAGIAYSGGGILYHWLHGLFGDPDEGALDALAPGGHGLVSLPYHAGHRPPVAAGAAGALYGLRLSTTAADIMAATLEGICHELADGARVLDPEQNALPVLGGGGVAESPWLARRLAAAFGGNAVRCLDREVAAQGAAGLAVGLRSSPRTEPVLATPSEVELMAVAARRHRILRRALQAVDPG